MDTYDFKLQCSGVWQEYMDLSFSGEKAKGAKECPAGTMAFGWRSYRGFVKRGDRDSYEFELNCKASSAVAGALRAMPNVQTLGLSQNVFVWSKHDVATWLGALGLGEHGEAFKMNNLQGDVIFLLLESHLQDLGMKKIGDRLYFMEVLTQLHDAVNSWSKMIGQSLSSTRTLPNLQRNGLPLQAGLAPGPGPGSSPSPSPGPAAVGVSWNSKAVLCSLWLYSLWLYSLWLYSLWQVVSWNSKEVSIWVEALGLAEWKPAFEKHRVQGDVMFALSEPALLEIGVMKIGDRLYLVDCLQSLHEEVTSWKTGQGSMRSEPRQLGGGPSSGPVTGLPSGATGAAAARHAAQEEAAQTAQEQAAAQQQRVPQIAGAARGGSAGASYGGGAGGGYGGAGGGGGGYGGGGGGGGYGGGGGGAGGAAAGSAGGALLKQLMAQGYSMQEVLKLAQSSPALMAQLSR